MITARPFSGAAGSHWGLIVVHRLESLRQRCELLMGAEDRHNKILEAR